MFINSSWGARQENTIAQGALTNSKRPECMVKGVYPTHVVSGVGPYVIDTNNKKYLDFICGLGSVILGYGRYEIATEIFKQAQRGVTFSLSTIHEVECAETLKQIFPFIDVMKFMKTGSDVCNAAIRIARTYTKRSKVLSSGYHGMGEEFISLMPPALGITGKYNIEKFENFSQVTDEIAAVIIEPVNLRYDAIQIQWLHNLRERCTKHGVVLIFDEIITGFRFPQMSVANATNCTPDIICLGKAIANGMPLAVVAGKKNVMNCGEYFVSSTFAGETLSLVAARKTMEMVCSNRFSMNELWKDGQYFLDKFNSFNPELIKIEGYPTRGVFVGEQLNKALFWQECVKAGILFGSSWFFSWPHVEHIEQVLSSCKDIIRRIESHNVKLEGELPKSPFAAQMRK